MLFKVFLISIIMMNAYHTTHPVELYAGRCMDVAGNGHLEFCMQEELREPFTYIRYHGADASEYVITTLEMGDTGEPDDVLFRHDVIVK